MKEKGQNSNFDFDEPRQPETPLAELMKAVSNADKHKKKDSEEK